MNLTDYQIQAAATAEAPAYDDRYLIPGIVAEFGELQGHRAKAFWQDRDPQATSRAIILEYGDLLWLTAIALQAAGVTSEDQFPDHVKKPRLFPNQAPEAAVANAIHRIFATWLDEDPANLMPSYWGHLWVMLNHYAEDITGVDAETVMRENIAKLAARANAGTLHGDGDYR